MKIPQLDRARTLAGILLFGLLAMTARNAVDPDLWWHLRTGQWIVETGHIPHADPFSFTRAGSPWVSHEWLSEVAFYEIWKYAGAAGLIIFSAVVTTAGFMLLYLRCPGKAQGAAAAALALGALAAAPAWGVRPQMFTFALASLLLWLLERGQERARLLLWIPPLFLLWLNLHAGFALGPALLFACCVGLVWEVASGNTAWQDVRPYLVRVLLVLLACMALVPLNPSGAQLYRYPLDVLRSAGMRSFIVEWLPPDFHQLRYVPLFLIWLALLVALGSSRSRPKARVLAPVFLTFLAAMDAVRHIPILALFATPVIAAIFSAPSSRAHFSPERSPRPSSAFRLAFRGVVLLLMAGFAVTRWHSLVRNQVRTEAELFPSQAVEFLRSHPVPGRLFAYYDWGGYAIWKLYPEYRVFVDGRADLYGDDLLHQFQKAMELQAGWEQILDTWGVQTVLVPPTCSLAEALLLDEGWHAEYRDSQAVLLLRIHPTSENTGVFRNLPRQRANSKNVYRSTPESAKLPSENPFPPSDRGENKGGSRKQCTNAVPKSVLWPATARLIPPGWRRGPTRSGTFEANFGGRNDERSGQTVVAQ